MCSKNIDHGQKNWAGSKKIEHGQNIFELSDGIGIYRVIIPDRAQHSYSKCGLFKLLNAYTMS